MRRRWLAVMPLLTALALVVSVLILSDNGTESTAPPTAPSLAPTGAPPSAAGSDGRTPAPTAATRVPSTPASATSPVAAVSDPADAALPPGVDLATVSHHSGVAPHVLTGVLANDPTARVTDNGYLTFIDTKPDRASGASTRGFAAGASRVAAQTLTQAQTFGLHSKPGSPHTVYLDFVGVTVSSTMHWHEDPDMRVPAKAYPGWDPAGDGATTWDAAELDAVQDIWARVAEDYAPFDVDVTTEAPADVSALYKDNTADDQFGTRVVISGSSEPGVDICGQDTDGVAACGGVAWTGVIDDPPTQYGDGHGGHLPADYDDIAWVFPGSLYDDPVSIADAAAHETGHTFGLVHDGTPSEAYDSPSYSANQLWGPIMGAPYFDSLSQWSKGEYPNARLWPGDTPTASQGAQPEVADIGAIARFRADEAPGVTTAAPSLPGSTAYITDQDDRDVYDLGTCAGDATVSAAPAASGANLDLQLRLLDATGAQVGAVADPTTTQAFDEYDDPVPSGLDASLTVPAAGHFYVEVDGQGQGSWATGGYGDYGSIGAYTIDSFDCSAVPPSAPTGLVAGVSSAGLTISWQPPASLGGASITGYLVQVDGQADQTVGGSTLTASFPDVHAGGVTVTVTAINSQGTGAPASTQTVEVPTAPTGLAASTTGALCPLGVTGRRCLTLAWSAPTDAGGSVITGYRVSVRSGSTWQVVADDVSTLQAAVALTPGVPTDVQVQAINGVGVGDPAPLTVTLPPMTATAVQHLTATLSRSGSTQVLTIHWQTPLDGDLPTGYRLALLDPNGREFVSDDGFGPADFGAMFALFPTNPPGVYGVDVQAVNGAGLGAHTIVHYNFNLPAKVTPAKPKAPQGSIKSGRKGGKKTVIFSWKPGSAGTKPITGYQLTIYSIKKRKAKVLKRVSAKASLRKLEMKLAARKGVTYAFSVRAHNAIGWSPLSTRSKGVSPK